MSIYLIIYIIFTIIKRGDPLDKKIKKRNIIMTIIIISVIAATAVALVFISLKEQKKAAPSNASLSAEQVVSGVIKKMNYQKKRRIT